MADIITFPGQRHAAPNPTNGNEAPDIQSLHTTFAALLLAHHAPCGCRPNEQQINEIGRLSDDAVAAIRQVEIAAEQFHKEQQH